MTFGEKLKESRKIKNLTQKQLADKIGAKHNSVSDWENDKNKPDPDTIELLCGVLGISPNYLLNSNSDDFSLREQEIIKRFRALDEPGRKEVLHTLEIETDRVKFTQRMLKYVSLYRENAKRREELSRLPDYSETISEIDSRLAKLNHVLDAAHERTDMDIPKGTDISDNDIMDDDNF